MTIARRLGKLESVRGDLPDHEVDAAFARLVASLDRAASGDGTACLDLEALRNPEQRGDRCSVRSQA